YVFKLIQTGTSFQVDKAITCGVRVSGTATVQLTDGGKRGLIHRNPQGTDTPAPRTPRRGTFSVTGGHCSLSMDRIYIVRGADEKRFLPPDFLAKPEL